MFWLISETVDEVFKAWTQEREPEQTEEVIQLFVCFAVKIKKVFNTPGETWGLKFLILFENCIYECNAFFMEEHCTVGILYLVFYVVRRNICTSSTLFISKILFPT